MGRWQPVGLTEGLWREVAAPPPLAFSERPPSPWLRHREDRQWQLTTPKQPFPLARTFARLSAQRRPNLRRRRDDPDGDRLQFRVGATLLLRLQFDHHRQATLTDRKSVVSGKGV